MKKKVFIISIFLLLIIIIFSIILFQYIDKKNNKVSFGEEYISDLNNINSNDSEEYINDVLEENMNITNIEKETQVINESNKTKEQQSITESNNYKIQNNTISNDTKKVEKKVEKKENNITNNNVLNQDSDKTKVTVNDEIKKNQVTDERDNENESKIERCTNNLNHGISVGNSGKWFNTKEEAISYYEQLIKDYGYKFESELIEQEEYNKKCPYGYEIWNCMFCNKWTINFYYREE